MNEESEAGIEVVVGRIGKPHGIRGEVTLDVRTDEPERRFAPGTVLRAQAPAGADRRPSSLTVARARWHQSTLLVTFEELADRTAAEAVRGTVLHATIAPDEVPEDPEEYYDHQLVGLSVVDLDGTALGEVKAVVHGAAQDLLSVRTTDGRGPRKFAKFHAARKASTNDSPKILTMLPLASCSSVTPVSRCQALPNSALASPTVRCAISGSECVPTKTWRAVRFRREPRQSGQGCVPRYFASSSRTGSESVSL